MNSLKVFIFLLLLSPNIFGETKGYTLRKCPSCGHCVPTVLISYADTTYKRVDSTWGAIRRIIPTGFSKISCNNTGEIKEIFIHRDSIAVWKTETRIPKPISDSLMGQHDQIYFRDSLILVMNNCIKSRGNSPKTIIYTDAPMGTKYPVNSMIETIYMEIGKNKVWLHLEK